MAEPNEGLLGITRAAWDRLRKEQGYLERARTLFRGAGDEELLQLAFAENQEANDRVGVIRQYVALVDKGITPPPHILASVAVGLRAYLEGAESELSLDKAFGLSRKQKIGHPLTHRKEKEARGRVAYLMWCLRRAASIRGESLSIENAASEAINRFNLPYSEDVLKKVYIEVNADEIFDRAAEVMQEAAQSGRK